VTVHQLKIWPHYFQDVEVGQKAFEIRRNDRDFRPSDALILNEYDPISKEYSGRSIRVFVIAIWDLTPIGLPGLVAMSISDPVSVGKE
jgi:hypothetical protein